MAICASHARIESEAILMVVMFKAIKPARLKDKELRLELLNEMRKQGTVIKNEFAKATKTWEHKPKFEVLVGISPDGPQVLVDTDDPIFRYVNDGTRPHMIFAGIYTGKSKKKALAFNSGFTAKTRPRIIGSEKGWSGGAKVLRPYVQHPGTEAREFDEVIAKQQEAHYKRAMEDAMKRAAAKSGMEMP